jgi:hypothetical protein
MQAVTYMLLRLKTRLYFADGYNQREEEDVSVLMEID